MAKASGRVRTTGRTAGGEGADIRPGGTGESSDTETLKGLRDIPNRRSQEQIQSAVAQFSRLYGLGTVDVKYGDAGANTYGYYDPSRNIVVLNERYYDDPKVVLTAKKRGYDSGFSVKTNAPLKHTAIHELAHAHWNTFQTGGR